jgi:uncharacterized protein involved in exopolysaccharide biosynthesis/Mrp family chromosome partitioning ATPase
VTDTLRHPTSAAQVGSPLLGQIRNFIEDDEPEPLDPLGLVKRAIRGRTLVIALLAFAVAFILASITWLAVAPAYQSTGVFRVLPRETKLLYADVDDSRLRLWDAFVTAELHLMQSRPVLENAWRTLEQTPGKPFPLPDDVSTLGEMINVSNRKGLVTVSARSGDPQLSAATVNAVLVSYESHKAAARDRVTDVRRSELDGRVATLTSTLRKLDDNYLAVGGEHDITSLSKAHIVKTAQLEILEERIGELDITLAQMRLTGNIGADEFRRSEIQRALLLDQAMTEMTYARARHKATLATLKKRYQPTHSIVLGAELELGTLEDAIAARKVQITTLGNVATLTGGTVQPTDQSFEEMQSVRQNLFDRRIAVSVEASRLIDKLVRIRRIAAEQIRVGDLLDETKQALDEVLVESQADLARPIDMIARGKVPDGPIEDKRKVFAFGAAVFGAMTTFISFIFTSLINPLVRYSDDLDTRTADKITAIVCKTRDNDLDLRRASFKLRNEIDMRRTSIGKPLVIGVAGVSQTGEPARMATNLSCVYAARDLNVLLIDADPNATLTKELQLHQGMGLANVVGVNTPIVEAIQVVETPNGSLQVMGAGTANMNLAGDLVSTLSIEDFRQLIDKVASHHDIVIVALGVLAAGRHSALGASVSEQFVLVTSTGNRKRKVADAVALLDRITPDRYMLAFKNASRLDPMIEQVEETITNTSQSTGWLKCFQKI